MKKLIVVLGIIMILTPMMGWALPPSPGMPEVDTNCNQAKYFAIGTLCQDSDDGVLYKGTGAAVVELAAGASGDMTKATYDVLDNGKIDGDKIDPISADLITSGTLNITTINLPSSNANPGTTAGQIRHDTVDTLATGGVVKWYDGTDVRTILDTEILSANGTSLVTAADYAAMKVLLGLVISTNVQAYDADLTTYAGITPTANAQTLLGETFAQMQASLSIDDLITLSGVLEGAVHLGTFTGATITDNQTIKAALQLIETALELRATIASPTFTGVATFPNEGLKILDTGGDHELIIKPGTDLGADRILTITTGDAARTLTISGDSTVNQDVSSTANPAFATINVTGANALNVGTSRTNDGVVRFKSGTALNDFYHEIRGSNFGANTLWILPTAVPGGANYLLNVDADGTMGYTDPASISLSLGNWKMFYSNGTGVLTEVALGAAGTVLMSNGATEAPTMQAPSGAGDVTSVGDATSGAALDGTSDGGTYIELYNAGGNNRLINTAGVFEVKTAAGAAYADVKMGGLTITTTVTGMLKATSGVVAAATAGSDYPGLASANTFTGNNTFGDADTDTLTLRSILAGGNSRAVQITDALATPTYADGVTDLYVKRYIQSDGGMYAPFFESALTAGNVGYVRIKEDPNNGFNFRGLSVASTLDQDLTFTFPNGNNTANQFFLLGTPAGNVSAMTYGTFSTADFAVAANEVTIKALGVDVAQINATGTPGSGNFLRGDGAWETVTAAAAGADGLIQYAATGALASEAAFKYTAATNTLNITVDGANPGLTIGDGTYTLGHTPQLYVEGIAEIDGILYADGGAVIGAATSLAIPNAASPTVDATGEIAVRSGAGAAGGLAIYSNAAPGSVMIPVYIPWSPITVKDPVATSDYLYGYTPYAITLRGVHYLVVGGTNWVGQLQICDANGGSCANTQAADSTVTPGTTVNVTSFSDATVPSGVWMYLKTTSISNAPTSITVQADYTVD